jgi:ribosomal protein S18 acetylase RimI-like enzyme
MSPLTIRPYDPRRDEAWAYALWQRTLGQLWPLSQATFHHVTVANAAYRAGDHAVAQIGARRVGFVASQVRQIPGEPAPRGQLTLILVEPRYQRRGIGRTLLEGALSGLRQRGVVEVQLGGGGLAYFWAGVPANLPSAWAFFQACGWAAAEQSFDLVRPLRDYTTRPETYARIPMC